MALPQIGWVLKRMPRNCRRNRSGFLRWLRRKEHPCPVYGIGFAAGLGRWFSRAGGGLSRQGASGRHTGSSRLGSRGRRRPPWFSPGRGQRKCFNPNGSFSVYNSHQSQAFVTEKQKEKENRQEGQQNSSGTKQSKWPTIVSGLLIGGLVVSYFVFPGFQSEVKQAWEVLTSGEQKRISDYVSRFGFWGPLLIVLAMVAQMFLVVVNVVALMLVAIIAYGPVWGTLIAVGAVLVASTVAYFIGRALGEVGVSKIIGEKAEKKVAGFMNEYGLWAIVIARISPFLSNDAVSFVAGFAGMGFWQFIGATTAGILPLAILLAWLGQDFDRLKTGLIWVSAISLALFVAYVVYDKYFKK